jgi:hypothetical protein
MSDFNPSLIPPSLKALPIWLLHHPGMLRAPPADFGRAHSAYLLQRGAVGMAIQPGEVAGTDTAVIAFRPLGNAPPGGWPCYVERADDGGLTGFARCAAADFQRLNGVVLSGAAPITGRRCSNAPQEAPLLSLAILNTLGIVPVPETPRGDLPAGGSEPAAGVPQARGGAADGTDAPTLDDDDDYDATCTVVVTFFADHTATTKREQSWRLDALAELIHTTAASDKARLPWLKLARFGERRTDKGSLRHNDNVVAITGIEGDYDRGEMSLAEAKDISARAEITAILYPSPSYTPAKPKWRVLAPFSQEYPPEARDRFMARLNGLFGGVFSRESWVLSQSYYYGRVANPDHHAVVFEGTPIDLADHLDAGAIGQPKERNVGQKAQPAQKPEDIAEARIRGLVQRLLDNIRAAKDGEKHHTLRDQCLSLGGFLHLTDWSVDEAVEQAIGALPSADDWDQARETARWAVTRGMANPLQMEERANLNPKRRNDPTDDPGYRQSQDQEARDQQPDDEPAPPAPRPGRILSGDAFIASYVPPDWLIDGVVQRGRLYACTSLTGHGKTAVWLFNACMIQAGRMVGNLDVVQGNVLILAGENPEDLKARMHGMAGTYKLKLAQLPFVLPGNFPLDDQEADALLREIAGLGVPISLIVGDTAASFFPADDENDNVKAGKYARTLRRFTLEVDGNPTVVMLCHPVKNASRTNLLPRGGGAFLNELDGNLVLWSESQGEVTELHWQAKIRGPDFSPIGYRLRSVPTGFIDRRDRPVMTIVAEPMSEEAVADHTKQTRTNEDAVLQALRDHPDWSWSRIAREAGWVSDNDQPEKWKVRRAIRSLAEDKLIQQKRKGDPWTLTEKGEEAIRKDN